MQTKSRWKRTPGCNGGAVTKTNGRARAGYEGVTVCDKGHRAGVRGVRAGGWQAVELARSQCYSCVVIPAFNEVSGNLPPGIHGATWEEMVTRYGSRPHRLYLLAGLKQALDALKAAGCKHTGEPKGIIAVDLGGLP